MTVISRLRLLLIVALPLALSSACGDEAGEPNPVALVAAFFDELPADLPDGIEQTEDLELGAGGSGEKAIAGAALYYGSDDVLHDVFIDLFRNHEDARASLDENADLLDVDITDDADASGCMWDDLVLVTFCVGQRGPVTIEIDSYSAGDEEDADPETIEAEADKLYKAIDAHIERLIDDASDDFAPVPRLPLAALLRAVPPPAAPDGTAFTEGFDVTSDDLLAQFEDSLNHGWSNDDGWRATYYVFADREEAETYRDRWIGNGTTTDIDDPEGTCVRTRDTETDAIRWWVCIAVSDEVLIFARHDNEGDELDEEAVDLLRGLVSYVEMLRAGELPPAAEPDKSERTPERTRRPEASPSATVEPTATANPSVAAVNAGTWTFPVVVKSNDCDGGQPSVGSTIQLQYKVTELGGDGLLAVAEFFKLEQLLPGYRDFGVFAMTLPVLKLDLPVSNGEVTGIGRLSVEFVAAGTAHARYTEDYGSCSIEADSRQ